MPDFVPFQLVKLVSKPPASDRWLNEIKYDGYRIQVRVEANSSRFHTRNGLDWTGPRSSLAWPWPQAVWRIASSTASSVP